MTTKRKSDWACCKSWVAVGGPILDGDGNPLTRCSLCGLPRGTVVHASLCTTGGCGDPDASLRRELESLKARIAAVEREVEHDPYPKDLRHLIMPEDSELQRGYVRGYHQAQSNIRAALSTQAEETEG